MTTLEKLEKKLPVELRRLNEKYLLTIDAIYKYETIDGGYERTIIITTDRGFIDFEYNTLIQIVKGLEKE